MYIYIYICIITYVDVYSICRADLNIPNHSGAVLKHDESGFFHMRDFTWKMQTPLGSLSSCQVFLPLPSVDVKIAMENGRRHSEFSHEQRPFSIAMLNYQRVNPIKSH